MRTRSSFDVAKAVLMFLMVIAAGQLLLVPYVLGASDDSNTITDTKAWAGDTMSLSDDNKSGISQVPKHTWLGRCPGCPIIPKYETNYRCGQLIDWKGWEGWDIGKRYVDHWSQCKDICLGTKRCNAITFFKRWRLCALKHLEGHPKIRTNFANRAASYQLCEYQVVGEYHKDKLLTVPKLAVGPSGGYKRKLKEDCLELCKNTKWCKAFNFVSETQRCELLQSTSNFSRMKKQVGATSYTLGGKEQCGFWMGSSRISGCDLEDHDTKNRDECISLCEKHPQCNAVTYTRDNHCWMHSTHANGAAPGWHCDVWNDDSYFSFYRLCTGDVTCGVKAPFAGIWNIYVNGGCPRTGVPSLQKPRYSDSNKAMSFLDCYNRCAEAGFGFCSYFKNSDGQLGDCWGYPEKHEGACHTLMNSGRSAVVCPEDRCNRFVEGMNYPYSNIKCEKKKHTGECVGMCARTKGCNGAVWINNSNVCCLKNIPKGAPMVPGKPYKAMHLCGSRDPHKAGNCDEWEEKSSFHSKPIQTIKPATRERCLEACKKNAHCNSADFLGNSCLLKKVPEGIRPLPSEDDVWSLRLCEYKG